MGLQAKSTQYLAEIAAGTDNQQRLLNDKLTEAIVALNDMSNVFRSKLDAVVAGSNNQQNLLNEKLSTTIALMNDQTNVLRAKLDAVIAGVDNQSRLLNEKLDALIKSSAGQSGLTGDKRNPPGRRADVATGDAVGTKRPPS